MIAPVSLPPGVWRNGTAYQAKNRWYDANLVRWRNGTGPEPIGGWSDWSSNTFTGVCRGLLGWTDNSGNAWVAQGSATKLEVYDDAATPAKADITPAGITTGIEDATASAKADTWSLDTWGEYLVGCLTSDGTLYEWQLDHATPTTAAAISNAPTSCNALLVTADRILMALGAGGDPRKIQWCDQEDNTNWTDAITNFAGSYNLETSGQVVSGTKVRGQNLILTDEDAWTATFVGQPFVYSFNRVGKGCGLPAANALVALPNGGAVWRGYKGFYLFDGASVRELSCDVLDYLLDNEEMSQLSKMYGFTMSEFDEVWWLYESSGGGECDSYVKWNYSEGHWDIGSLDRSAGIDRGAIDYPLLAHSTDNKIRQHEDSTLNVSNAPFAESGVLELGVGERIAHVRYLWPDEDTLGDCQVKFKTRLYPTATESTSAAYTLANPTSVREMGRQIRLRVEGARTAAWRWGVARLDLVPGGRR